MPGFTFTAVLTRPEGVGTWTFVNIPIELSETFGSKGQVRVKGTVNGYPFRSTALPMGDGTHYLVVGKPIRDQIHAAPGDSVTVTMEIDAEQRQVSIPDELAREFTSHPAAKSGFEKLSFSQQKLYVDWILGAKSDETRLRRVENALERLAQGKKLRG